MRSCDKTYTITEYGGFTRGAALHGYQGLPEKTFDALEAFILANRQTQTPRRLNSSPCLPVVVWARLSLPETTSG